MCPIVVSLKSVRFVVFAALLAAVVDGIRAGGGAGAGAFYGVGDLPGGSFSSQIRDATKVRHHPRRRPRQWADPGCADPCPAGDTAILWKWDGVSATLTALPNLVVNTSATTFITASAITPDGATSRAGRAAYFPAAHARPCALRQRLSLPRARTSTSRAFRRHSRPSTFAVPSRATAPCSMESRSRGSAAPLRRRQLRALIPLLSGATELTPAGRGASADGSCSSDGVGATATTAAGYRYVHGTGSAAIPRLTSGGTWNGRRAYRQTATWSSRLATVPRIRTARPISTTRRPAQRRRSVRRTARGRRAMSPA